jgi:hypothetical protein
VGKHFPGSDVRVALIDPMACRRSGLALSGSQIALTGSVVSPGLSAEKSGQPGRTGWEQLAQFSIAASWWASDGHESWDPAGRPRRLAIVGW